MSTCKRLVPALLLMVLCVSGCTSPGVLTAREEAGHDTALINVSIPGTYGLFIAGDADPIFRFKLQEKDKIGFEHGPAGVVGEMQFDMVYAIAGQNRIPLDITQTYEWRRL